MARFNISGQRPAKPVTQAASPLRTTGARTSAPDTQTFEGAPAWQRDAKTDLYLRATSSFHGGESSFYESAEQRDDKLRELVRIVAQMDFPWLCEFAWWLRGPGNIRTAAIMTAVEGAKATLDDEKVFSRQVDRGEYTRRKLIDGVCQRPDEPGEILGYWTSRYGRKIPKPIKRGLADAAQRLYNERSLLKYDTSSHAWRFADVIELCHPSPDPADTLWQGALFQYALDRRHHPDNAEIPETLTVLRHNKWLREAAKKDPKVLLSNEHLRDAGMTWEDTLSLSGALGLDKKKVWEAVIPSMGYMALLRNLRNFDETGVSDTTATRIVARLADEQQVRKSRQLPFRFYSAYKAAPSLRWAHALETALDLCLPNIPTFTGRTLVLVDTSASMGSLMSGKSQMRCVEGAALFGSALAIKNPESVDLVQFASHTMQFTIAKGGSVLKQTETIMRAVGDVGHGTNMQGAISERYSGHDRVIILSDMQAFGHGYRDVAVDVPQNVPVYGFNLSAYSASPMPTGDTARFDLGGLTDATFSLIPRLEAGLTGAWPWEAQD